MAQPTEARCIEEVVRALRRSRPVSVRGRCIILHRDPNGRERRQLCEYGPGRGIAGPSISCSSISAGLLPGSNGQCGVANTARLCAALIASCSSRSVADSGRTFAAAGPDLGRQELQDFDYAGGNTRLEVRRSFAREDFVATPFEIFQRDGCREEPESCRRLVSERPQRPADYAGQRRQGEGAPRRLAPRLSPSGRTRRARR